MNNVSCDTKKSRGRPPRLGRTAGASIAEAIFHREGYDQAAIATICDALGVRQPALYRVFGSKAGLFEAALESYGSSVFASQFEDEIRRASSPAELKRNLLLRAARTYTAVPERFGCMAFETAFNCADEEAQASAKKMVDHLREALAIRFAQLGTPDPEAEARAILLVLRGLSSEARAGATAGELRAAVETLVVRDDPQDASVG